MEAISFNDLPAAVLKLFDKLSAIEALMLKISSPGVEEEKILSVEEAAAMLGLAVPTIYGLVSRRAIPVSKRNKRLYFSRKELIEWIKEGRMKTSHEVMEEAKVYTTKRNS